MAHFNAFFFCVTDSVDWAAWRIAIWVTLGCKHNGDSNSFIKDWLANALKVTGNYGEIFERNVGSKSAIKLPRGTNNLWNKGGLMYAPPLR